MTSSATPHHRPLLKWLRIAATVLSLLACLLLVAMWVRSLWWMDGIAVPVSGSRSLAAWSNPGFVQIGGIEYFQRQQFTMTAEEYQSLSGAQGVRHSPIWGTFGHQYDRLMLPYWLLVSLAATVGAVPWIKWRRSYSLRKLLVVVTLVALLLGIIVTINRQVASDA